MIKYLKQKLEALAVAMAFAEANDARSARAFLEESDHRQDRKGAPRQKRSDRRPRPRIYRS